MEPSPGRSESQDEWEATRTSRATVPIAPEDLRDLVDASVDGQAVPRSSSRATPTGLPVLENDVRADDSAPMTAEQEFGASGGSISEALSTVAAQRGDRPADRAASELADMEAKPQLLVPLQDITWHKLDHQAGFLLSRIDGTLSYAELLTISGMPEPQALRILARLLELELIGSTS